MKRSRSELESTDSTGNELQSQQQQPSVSLKAPQLQPRVISFIQQDSTTKKFRITEEAKRFLKSIPSPLSVICLLGAYRTGKSFLLNRLLQHKGFQVGHTTNSCTRGILLCTKIIESKNKSCHSIVLDTEGLMSVDQDQTHDVNLFALSLLISSTLMLNTTGRIDKHALENLSLVTQISKWIKNHSSSSDGKGDETEYMPNFIFLLRDFALSIVSEQKDDQGNFIPVSSSDYLENCLNQDPEIGKSIRSCFKERDCFVFSRPCDSPSDLQRLDTLPPSALRKDFMDQMDNLRDFLKVNMRPKTMFNKPISGDTFVKLAELYVEAINNNTKELVIRDTWSLLQDSQNASVVQELIQSFEQDLNNNLHQCQTKSSLDWIPLNCWKPNDAKRKWMFGELENKSFGDASSLAQYKEKLVKECEQIQLRFQQENELKWNRFCQDTLHPKLESLVSEVDSVSKFSQSIHMLWVNLIAEPFASCFGGGSSSSVLQEFKQTHWTPIVLDYSMRWMTFQESKMNPGELNQLRQEKVEWLASKQLTTERTQQMMQQLELLQSEVGEYKRKEVELNHQMQEQTYQLESLKSQVVQLQETIEQTKTQWSKSVQSKTEHEYVVTQLDQAKLQLVSLTKEKEESEAKWLLEWNNLQEQSVTQAQEWRIQWESEKVLLTEESEKLALQLKQVKQLHSETASKLQQTEHQYQESKTSVEQITKVLESERREQELKWNDLQKELRSVLKENHALQQDLIQTKFEQQLEARTKIQLAETNAAQTEMRMKELNARYQEQEKAWKLMEAEWKQMKDDQYGKDAEFNWIKKQYEVQITELNQLKDKNLELERKNRDLDRENKIQAGKLNMYQSTTRS